MLELDDLTKHFGGVRAVDGVDLTVARRRDSRPDRPERLGQEHDRQPDLRPVSADRGPRRASTARTFPICRRTRACRSGIARTFQNIRLFGQLTVWQNLWVAQNSGEQRQGESLLTRWFGGARRARDEDRAGRWSSSTSRTSATNWPAISHSASSGGSSSPARFAAKPALAAARRARGGHECRGDRPARCPHPQAAPGRHHHSVDRASCRTGHVGGRPHRRAQFRPEDRGRRRRPKFRPIPLVREAYLGTAAAA